MSAAALWESNFGRAVQTLMQIDRVARGDDTPVDLVGPDFEALELCGTERCREGTIRGVEAHRDLDATDARRIEARIEGHPATAQIHFAVRMKVERASRIGHAYVR